MTDGEHDLVICGWLGRVVRGIVVAYAVAFVACLPFAVLILVRLVTGWW